MPMPSSRGCDWTRPRGIAATIVTHRAGIQTIARRVVSSRGIRPVFEKKKAAGEVIACDSSIFCYQPEVDSGAGLDREPAVRGTPLQEVAGRAVRVAAV